LKREKKGMITWGVDLFGFQEGFRLMEFSRNKEINKTSYLLVLEKKGRGEITRSYYWKVMYHLVQCK
jgi:hypothetical protein